VAYSGAQDGPKASADIMAKAMAAEGLNLTHVIGVNAKHFYTPKSRVEINRRIDSIADFGREPFRASSCSPRSRWRYNQVRWLTINSMGKHWSGPSGGGADR